MTAITDALQALLDHVDSETCRHEDTHRGGAIWTICDGCGMEWADDQGGFKPYEDAPAVAHARAALAAPSHSAPSELVWPAGYCLDPDGKMCVPEGRKQDWDFGYEIGFREAMGIKMRASLPDVKAAEPTDEQITEAAKKLGIGSYHTLAAAFKSGVLFGAAHASSKLPEPELDGPVAEVVECQRMGGQTLREIDGRWKFLAYGAKLYAAAPIKPEPRQAPSDAPKVTPAMVAAFKAAFQEGSIWTDRFEAGLVAAIAAQAQKGTS